jgi:hypothetical protein
MARTRPTTVTDQSTRHSGGLSGLRGRTVRSSSLRKQTETHKFWTHFDGERRTVRNLVTDCPQANSQKTHQNEHVLDFVLAATVDCPQ